LISPLAEIEKLKPSSLPSPSNTPLSPIQVAVSPKEVSESNPTSSHTTSCISSISSPTAQYFSNNLDVAEIGSLAVENHEVFSVDTQPAAEYSSTTIEYYNDIDNCLETSGVNQIKKKKKKKKKTNNSGSNSSLPSPPLVIPTAAVGSLTVKDENALAALERQNDPRYRPIEDLEFVPFEEW
jgi:hypothetical protein